MEQKKYKTPIWFWVFTIPFALLGVIGLLQVTSIWDANLPEPVWARVGYTVGILGVLAGGILMTLRKRLAIPALVTSILGFVIHRSWLFFMSDILSELPSIAPLTLMGATILNIAAIWILSRGIRNGWVR